MAIILFEEYSGDLLEKTTLIYQHQIHRGVYVCIAKMSDGIQYMTKAVIRFVPITTQN